jgi:hypothetical protein
MAEQGAGGICATQLLKENANTNEVNTCQRCKNYETLLKETIDELNSA